MEVQIEWRWNKIMEWNRGSENMKWKYGQTYEWKNESEKRENESEKMKARKWEQKFVQNMQNMGKYRNTEIHARYRNNVIGTE
jgi:hypothetical protein